jgi:hypothetical protein
VSALATEIKRPRLTEESATGRSATRLFEPSGWTLEDVILVVWEDLTAGNPAECPVCQARIRVSSGCESCGSELS